MGYILLSHLAQALVNFSVILLNSYYYCFLLHAYHVLAVPLCFRLAYYISSYTNKAHMIPRNCVLI